MAINVSWKLQAAVQGGPNLAAEQPSLSVDAYDVTQVTVPKGAAGLTVHVQPTLAAGEKAVFFALTSSQYDAAKLTYTVNANVAIHSLDAPLLLIGGGAVGLLDATPVYTLAISNALDNPVNIQILVGRNSA